MSSVSAVCRLSSRIAARSARRKATARSFSQSATPCAAQNFTLPALSPTMTEGGISSWKVKEGDSFSTGDVLLEIETDKAQMDVEAQEDGIVFKIFEQDGAKGIKVGARIAVLAEPGDDLSTLEVPKEDSTSETKTESSSAASDKPEKKEESAPESKPSPSPPSGKQETSSSSSPPSSSDSSHSKPSTQKYPLYPSVQYLLHTLGVSSSDAAKISATGPNGRLLKGDVLAHLGKIEKSYPAEQSKRITKLGHLDLSNIKIASPKKQASAATTAPSAAAATPEPEKPIQLSLPISLAAVFATQKRIKDSLGLTLPLSTFIARASEIANESLPRAPTPPTADQLFDAVLSLDKLTSTKSNTTRGRYIPQITALPPASAFRTPSSAGATAKKPVDIIDMLSGGSAKKASTSATRTALPGAMGVAGAENVFSVSAKKGEEKRVMAYLERVKTVLEIEPGRCVL